MPKPKSGDLYVRELRITPADGLPITDWKINEDDFKQVIAAEEGGEDKKLHYHLYIESTRSESWIRKWIYSIAHCENGEQGNSVFFSRKPHENTLGYVVKYGNIVVRHGCSQTYIDEWIGKSDQYRKSKESTRKRAQRTRQSMIQEILDQVETDLKANSIDRTVHGITDALLYNFKLNGLYPMKNQFEMMVIKLIHPYNDNFVRLFYTNNLLR